MLPPKRRILCADDHEDTCFMLCTLFKQSECEVGTAGTIAEALRLASGGGFALYVIDVRFPDGSGFDLCEKLRALDPATPVIFYSGNAYDADRERALRAGAHAYITKPAVDKLIKTVMEVVEREGDDATVN